MEITLRPRIEIQASKKRPAFVFALSLLMIATGFVALIFLSGSAASLLNDHLIALLLCVFLILAFSHLASSAYIKLSNRDPALIIDNEGINDYSSRNASRKISWKDIKSWSLVIIQQEKIIMLQVKDPSVYIENEPNQSTREMMTSSYRMFGTPINIITNKLNIPVEDLMKIIGDHFMASREKSNAAYERSVFEWNYGSE